MKSAQQKVLTGTVLLMSAFLLGGCVSTSTTSPSSHKTTSAKVVKKSNKTSEKSAKQSSANKNFAFVATPATNNSSSNSTVTTTRSSVSQPASTTPSYAVANHQKSPSTATPNRSDADVLNSFIAASGLQQREGNYYFVQSQGNGQYRVEVRNTGKDQDQNVANLTGLYNYNANNNQVQKMDPITGQFN